MYVKVNAKNTNDLSHLRSHTTERTIDSNKMISYTTTTTTKKMDILLTIERQTYRTAGTLNKIKQIKLQK